MGDIYRNFLDLYEQEKSDNVKQNEKRFDNACEEFKKAELLLKPNASLLVKKGKCIQLSSERCPYSLEDAEKAFKDAIDEETDYIEAYIELAHYYLNVQSDPKTAKFYFEKALDIACKFACELVGGIGRCISEIESPEIALEYLKNYKLVLDDPILKNTIDEIQEK